MSATTKKKVHKAAMNSLFGSLKKPTSTRGTPTANSLIKASQKSKERLPNSEIKFLSNFSTRKLESTRNSESTGGKKKKVVKKPVKKTTTKRKTTTKKPVKKTITRRKKSTKKPVKRTVNPIAKLLALFKGKK